MTAIPVQEWREFLVRAARELERGEPLLYKNQVRDTDVLLDHVEASEMLSELQIIPALALRTVTQLLAFIASDTSPQMQTRVSRAAKEAALAAPATQMLTLERIAFVLAYMYTFCSGLWLERLAAHASLPDDEQPGAFSSHTGNMIFAIEGYAVSYPNALVSLKRAQNKPHMLVITFFQLVQNRFRRDSEPTNDARVRVKRCVFDMRDGSAADPAPELFDAQVYIMPPDATSVAVYRDLQVPPADVSAGDMYYELVRLLFQLYRTTSDSPNKVASLIANDFALADDIADEVPRGAWFCLTLEWLAFTDVREYLAQHRFLGDAVARARQTIVPPKNKPRRAANDVEINLRMYARQAAHLAIAERGLSAAAVYMWATLLVELFWLPLAKVDLALYRTPTEYGSRVDYFDSPSDMIVIAAASNVLDIGSSSDTESDVPATLVIEPANEPSAGKRTKDAQSPIPPTQQYSAPDDDDNDAYDAPNPPAKYMRSKVRPPVE